MVQNMADQLGLNLLRVFDALLPGRQRHGGIRIGLVLQHFVQQHGPALSIRPFPIPGALPEVDICLLWPTRLDADPAQRWLRDIIHDALRS
jgi:DNA-binding transcriptional LysR family regulator